MSDDPMPSSESGQAYQLISLADAAKISGLSQGHLRLLAKQGKIEATKIGRDWLTTEEAIRAYIATDRRPGPKPGPRQE